MAGNDAAFGIDQDWVDEAKLLDAFCNLPNLLLRMRAWIARPRPQFSWVLVGDLKALRAIGDVAAARPSIPVTRLADEVLLIAGGEIAVTIFLGLVLTNRPR